jgi:hypothetical protein
MPGGTLFVVKWGVSYVGKTNSHGRPWKWGNAYGFLLKRVGLFKFAVLRELTCLVLCVSVSGMRNAWGYPFCRKMGGFLCWEN